MTSKKIRNQLKEITDNLCDLIQEIPIEKKQDYPGIIDMSPSYYWGELSSSQENIQIKLKRKYDVIAELLKIIFHNAPNGVTHKVDESDKYYREWLELDFNWFLSLSREENDKKLREASEAIENLLDILEVDSEGKIILIPDTNSLLISSDPKLYETIPDSKGFIFLLLPTVLGELDELKILHRNPDVREKAKKAIKRIKGWRKQGSLTEGVTVNSTVTVMAEHKEPDMENTLSWLDTENSDDRIIASVLSVMSVFPSARVILVTGDINLQNKADSAMIEIGEME